MIVLLLVCLMSQSSYSQNKLKPVFLTGILKNYHSKIQVEDMSEFKELELPDSARTFLPDSVGHFSIRFKLDKPNYFRLGRNILYLTPGDSLYMVINYIWADSSTFKGKHSAENEYLKTTPFPKAGSYLEGGDNIKESIPETINQILEIARIRQITLNKQNHFSAEFIKLETARINADILNSINRIHAYFPYIHTLKGDSLALFESKYPQMVNPFLEQYSKNSLNPDYLKLTVYRDILHIIFNYTGKDSSANMRKIQDWIKARDIVQDLINQNDKLAIYSYKKKINTIQTREYKDRVNITYNKLMEFGNGDYAKDLVMNNSDNKTFHLDEYKGKVIYLDLWATWCGPCMEELPYLDSLKEKFKSRNDIVFITLSIDENINLWKKSLINRKTSGIQGIIDRSKLSDYKVSYVPRVIVINKKFVIVSMRGLLPSDKKTSNMLDQLLD